MALYDWNKNGEKDFGDDFIEYNIYKDVMGEKEEPSYAPRSNGMSSFGAGLAVVGGLVLEAFLFTILEVNIDAVPAFLLVILWPVCSAVLAYFIDKMGL